MEARRAEWGSRVMVAFAIGQHGNPGCLGARRAARVAGAMVFERKRSLGRTSTRPADPQSREIGSLVSYIRYLTRMAAASMYRPAKRGGKVGSKP